MIEKINESENAPYDKNAIVIWIMDSSDISCSVNKLEACSRVANKFMAIMLKPSTFAKKTKKSTRKNQLIKSDSETITHA